MAVAYRSISQVAYTTRTNTTVTPPSGIVDGDVLIFFLFIAISGTPPTPTAPSGFTALPTFPSSQFGAGGFNGRIYAWSKVAASESGSYTATHSSASSQGTMLAVSGPHPTAPFNPSPTINTGTGVTTTALGLTTVANGDLVIFIGTDWGTTTNNLTPPTGTTPTFTERADSAVTYVATGNLATAGATGNKSHTNNSSAADPWSGTLIAVTAAPLDVIQLRPDGDVAAGTWTSTGANLFSVLDDTSADDADKITSAATPTNDVAEVTLVNPATTTGGTTTIYARVKKT